MSGWFHRNILTTQSLSLGLVAWEMKPFIVCLNNEWLLSGNVYMDGAHAEWKENIQHLDKECVNTAWKRIVGHRAATAQFRPKYCSSATRKAPGLQPRRDITEHLARFSLKQTVPVPEASNSTTVPDPNQSHSLWNSYVLKDQKNGNIRYNAASLNLNDWQQIQTYVLIYAA